MDQREHQQNRDALQSMMTSGHTSFKLTLVSEPPGDDDDEADCEEIGKYCAISSFYNFFDRI